MELRKITRPGVRTARDLPRDAAALLALHRSGRVLTLPNAWDGASARALAEQGATAVATASAAVAHRHGYADGEQMPLDLAIAAIKEVADAVDLPVTADLEAGYGDPFASVRRAVNAGATGVNIEDGMLPLERSVSLMDAALAGAAAERVDLVLNARTDAYLVGDMEPEQRFDEAVARGRAYLSAGAACVFVPGVTDVDIVKALVAELGWRRVSILSPLDGPHAQSWAPLGVARVSYGPYVYRAEVSERVALLVRLLSDPT